MDTNEARRNAAAKLGGPQALNNHSKTLNTRSHTQMAYYQSTGQVTTLDKDKIMSKAYLGRTQHKNVMQTQKLQPLKLTRDVQRIQDSMGHIMQSKRASNNLSSLNMRKMSDN